MSEPRVLPFSEAPTIDRGGGIYSNLLVVEENRFKGVLQRNDQLSSGCVPPRCTPITATSR